MRVGVTGATGLIGSRLVAALRGRGDGVLALSRDPARASAQLDVEAVKWDPTAPEADALSGLDGIVSLAGEPVAQRWTDAAKERIRSSRVLATERLVEALARADPRPRVLVSASAAGYYGDRGATELEESAPPGDDFLASLCVEWERAADGAEALGVRVVKLRNGVVLDRRGGALRSMLPPFRAGVGGPVAGGRQYLPWVALDDAVGMFLAALTDGSWSGPVNASGPKAVTNREFVSALGRVLHRPAVVPVPALALRVLFGEMSSVLTASQRMVPRQALGLGYVFRHGELDEALRAALA
ncbi:MAG TPA: TIGR01777 family oxidoreductase [Solirubrobacteraceae bacterium]|jgi:hypothetical protein